MGILREKIEALNAAIADSACPYCGASPKTRCVMRCQSGKGKPAKSPVFHVDRVNAGHALLRLREEGKKP